MVNNIAIRIESMLDENTRCLKTKGTNAIEKLQFLGVDTIVVLRWSLLRLLF